MTYEPAQPARSNGVSAGPASDVKTFAAAALLTFATGLIVLDGYALLGNFFGAILGIVAAVFGIVWWRKQHDGTAFPRRLPTKSVVILAVVTALLAGLLLLVSG